MLSDKLFCMRTGLVFYSGMHVGMVKHSTEFLFDVCHSKLGNCVSICSRYFDILQIQFSFRGAYTSGNFI